MNEVPYLSEAIMLGAATCKMLRGDWNSCALGAAANAMGVPQGTELPLRNSSTQRLPDGTPRYEAIEELWPWLKDYPENSWPWLSIIAYKFDWEVCQGEITLEQLADYVKSIEPKCMCHNFNCSCAKTEEVAHELVHV